MKVEIQSKEEKKEIKFPCLMIGKNDEIIMVLKKREHGGYDGIQLLPKYEFRYEYATTWSDTYYQPFKGKVTLSNE